MNIDQLRKAVELADQLNQHLDETYYGTLNSYWIRKRALELRWAITGDLQRIEAEKLRAIKLQARRFKTPAKTVAA